MPTILRHGCLIYWGGLLISSCASHPVEHYKQSIVYGDLDRAEELISQDNSNNNLMLQDLHYGTLRQLEQAYSGSNIHFESAKQKAESLSSVSLSETVAAITVNQRVSQFSGNHFERLMIYLNKAFNYLALNEVNKARIEIRQAEILLQELRVETGDYPFVSLIIGLIYEKLDQTEDAYAAYRRAVNSYSADNQPLLLKKSYINLLAKNNRIEELTSAQARLSVTAASDSKQASLLIIATRGIMTSLGSFVIEHLHPEYNQGFLIALPYYPKYPGILPPPSLNVGEFVVKFESIIDTEKHMRNALDKAMPAIIAVALARAVVKEQLRQIARSQDNAFLEFATLFYTVASEVADTRSWDTLPQVFYMSRLELAPGDYNLTYSYYPQQIGHFPTNITIEPGINFMFVQGR